MKKMLERDKLLHFAVCAVMSSVLHVFLPVAVTVALVMLVAFGKELYDKLSGKGCAELRDIVADVAGMIIGII